MDAKYDYDVTFSFAGEDRQFVEACAEILRSLKVNVFYDNFEKHTLFGENLYTYLADLYQNRARYAVVFISKYYKEKLWTHHELEFINARRFESPNDDYLLPVKLDNTCVEGIPSTLGYIEGTSPLEVSMAIAKKVDINLDFELMIKQLRDLLPHYTITVKGSNIQFDCRSEDFIDEYPIGLMMELYRYDLIEPLFVMASIVPN